MNRERKASINEQLSGEAANPYLQKSRFTTVGESGTDMCISTRGRDLDATSDSEPPQLVTDDMTYSDADAKKVQVRTHFSYWISF
jgi:hypothetical protein